MGLAKKGEKYSFKTFKRLIPRIDKRRDKLFQVSFCHLCPLFKNIIHNFAVVKLS